MPDIISPSTLEVNGAPVTNVVPMPCVVVAAPILATTQVISPRTWCVNGDAVSDLNPIPLSL